MQIPDLACTSDGEIFGAPERRARSEIELNVRLKPQRFQVSSCISLYYESQACTIVRFSTLGAIYAGFLFDPSQS